MSWHFTAEKITKQISSLAAAVPRATMPIGSFSAKRETGDVWQISAGDTYLAAAETVLLEANVTVPANWSGEQVYVALQLTGAETLAFVDGVSFQAIDLFHHDLLLAEKADGGKTHRLKLEAYTGLADTNNRTSWIGGVETVGDRVTVTVKTAELRLIDRDAEELYFDLVAALGSSKALDPNSREYTVVMDALDKTVNLLDFRFPQGDKRFYGSVKEAGSYLRKNFYDKYHADKEFTPVMKAVGHAHIDTAWLWPLAHTRKKIARSFSSQLTMAERFPGYVFTCSQPQQYAYIKEDHPEVYERIKAAIKRGQWETVGGMWIESDCNVVSGESLVRQFLYGQRFFEREFGTHNDVVWLPDVFGYSASMPQIIKKAGMKYFMTIKIYWSQVNKPPYQTFEWEGIDGTRVLSHFAPGGNYNADFTPEQVSEYWKAYNQKNVNDTSLYIFGYGDGGGGPTRQMLESAKRLEDFPGMPRVELSSAQEFFKTLEKQVKDNPMLPRWVGELYLEYHRGTYTSQARNKKANRQSEFALQTAEQIASLAMVTADASYPQAEINKAWELTLLNQFHDIIPGSSINAVYKDSDKDYAAILTSARQEIDSALFAVAATIAADAGKLVVYNPLSWQREDYAAISRSLGIAGQDVTDVEGVEQTLIPLSTIPATGYGLLEPTTPSVSSELTASTSSLNNRFFKIAFDKNGEIVSIIDKRLGREVIDQEAQCKGNALLSYEDRPFDWDAWDIDIFYQDKMYPVNEHAEIRVVEQGPIRASIEIKRQFGRGSTIKQRISVWADLPRIDFETLVDWQERQTLLKVAFPVDVHTARATYDIQFGNVERPTHWNTSWDWARFEVCGQKWADLSEGGGNGYGVALLSDSKYGWDIKGNIMRLTLLKGPIAPDKEADLGLQRFTYSLYPHPGDWRSAEVVRRAYELNVPVQTAIVKGGGDQPNQMSLVTVDQPNLIVETIKKAEDDDSLIVRLFETYGQRATGTLSFFRQLTSAAEVNLMEVETDATLSGEIEVGGAEIRFNFGPYEIKTFKVKLLDRS